MTIEGLRRKEDSLLKRYGWFAHVIEDDPSVATGFNYHTHGFDRSLAHYDLQIVLPVPSDLCHRIAKIIYDQIAGGRNFQGGDETKVVRQNGSSFSVRFVKVREGDRNVLRVILPSRNGGLEPEHVAGENEPEYALQWTV